MKRKIGGEPPAGMAVAAKKKEGILRIEFTQGMNGEPSGSQIGQHLVGACECAQGRKWKLLDLCCGYDHSNRDAEAPCRDTEEEEEDAEQSSSDHQSNSQACEYDHSKDVVEAPWLPFHLILERLPVRKQCQLRGVSKTWNSMLGGGHSHRLCKEVEDECWFIMTRPPKHGQDKWQFMAYSNAHSTDPSSFRTPLPNASHRKLFSLLGGEDCCRLVRRLRDRWQEPPILGNLQLRSAGGLMSAMVRTPEDGYGIIVFNCVTGSVEVLPPPLHGDKLSIGRGCFFNMILDSQNPGCFFIMLTEDITEPEAYSEIFESRNGCWKVGRDFTRSSFSPHLKVVEGDFFWLLSIPDCSRNRLVAYHVAHDAWSSLSVPARPYSLYRHKYGGRLFLRVALWGGNDRSRGFGVWELRLTSAETGTWVEVARTPEHLWRPLRLGTWSYDLYADGSLFWMTFWKRNDHCSFRPPLVFDMAKMSWYSLPLDRISRKFGCILVHRPSFHATCSGVALQEG